MPPFDSKINKRLDLVNKFLILGFRTLKRKKKPIVDIWKRYSRLSHIFCHSQPFSGVEQCAVVLALSAAVNSIVGVLEDFHIDVSFWWFFSVAYKSFKTANEHEEKRMDPLSSRSRQSTSYSRTAFFRPLLCCLSVSNQKDLVLRIVFSYLDALRDSDRKIFPDIWGTNRLGLNSDPPLIQEEHHDCRKQILW